MAARGYAVLLPDPALSTGYGHHFIARGHGQWGGQPYADLMAIIDEAEARPDIDGARTAMMGGSYGGDMGNTGAAGRTRGPAAAAAPGGGAPRPGRRAHPPPRSSARRSC